MSKSECLYVRGMNLSLESEEESVWDDSKLNSAYDKACKVANAEVARRVAMSTNTPTATKEENTIEKKEKKPSQRNASKNKPPQQWRVGMSCRSVYAEDGLEYEAYIMSLNNDEECTVRYIGYDNSEIVPIQSLKPSGGDEARMEQIEESGRDKADDGFASLSPRAGDDMRASDRAASPDSMVQASYQKKKSASKKQKNNARSTFELPNIPMMMPNISMMQNSGSMEMPMPMPPPPTAFTSNGRSDAEDEAISSMLLSWYMSGYYTGLYQGLKKSKENH